MNTNFKAPQSKESILVKAFFGFGILIGVGLIGVEINQYLDSRPIEVSNTGQVAKMDPSDPALSAPKKTFEFGQDSIPESKQKVDMSADPRAVYTYNCSDLVQTPKSMELMCDEEGDDYIADLVWTSWSVKGAVARGNFYKSSCDLRCDENLAEYVRFPMTLKLSHPVQEGKIIYFTSAKAVYKPEGKESNTEIDFDPSFLHKLSVAMSK